jgi:hypothetical protein
MTDSATQGPAMFRAHRVFSLLQPARPRHPIVQALFALLALGAFLVLLVVGIAIAAVVMIGGALLRAFSPSRPATVAPDPRPRAQADVPAAEGDIIDGEFRVVEKSIPHGTR